MPVYLYPKPQTDSDAMANLATAVLLQTVHDLQGGPSALRESACLSIKAHSLDVWMDVLSLTAEQRRRVQALLDELVH